MNLNEMFKKADLSEVLKELYTLYPEEEKNDAGYKEALYEILIETSPIKGEITERITVDRVYKQYEDPILDTDDYINIYSVDPKAEEDEFGRSGEDIHWALEFTPWENWLAMEVEVVTPDSRCDTRNKILAHILYEMTFCGYSNKEIKAEKDELISIKNELDKLLEEKGHDKAIEDGDLIPFEKVLEDLKNEVK